jgi:methyl-accepting chemotaxis protein
MVPVRPVRADRNGAGKGEASKMKKVSLIRKFYLIGGVFLVLVVMMLAMLMRGVSQLNDSNTYIAETSIPILNSAHELKLAVVQVQQWLTDISATRGLDGLDDGFAEAEKNAGDFRKLIARLQQYDPQNADQYRKMSAAFTDYYAVGKRMAQAYIDNGPAGGNKTMGDFDKVAATLAQQVDPTLNAIREGSNRLLMQQVRDIGSLRNTVIVSLLVMIALVGTTFYIMINAVRMLPRVVEELQHIADGDLSERACIEHNGDEIGALCAGLEYMKERLRGVMALMSSTSGQLAGAAEQMTAVSEQTLQAINRQQGEINQVATAMAEMSATAHEVAENASHTSESAREADSEAQQGQGVVRQSVNGISNLAQNVLEASEVIHRLDQDSEQIGSILDVIRGIAEQTNLLALNAAIEAARAGEQGRGFAVVADEVRTLAQRTQKSTQEIQGMIEQLQTGARNAVQVMEQGRQRTDESVEQSSRAGSSLDVITTAVSRITDMNLQIASAAHEQSMVAEEMTRNVTQINQMADETAEGARQTEQTSRELFGLANELQGLVQQFKV